MTLSKLTPAISVLASALVAGFISYGVTILTLGPTQDRQARLEATVEFSNSTKDIVSLSGDFLYAMTRNSDLGQDKAALRKELAVQIASVQGLAPLFGADVQVEAQNYLAAIDQFVNIINATNSVTDVGTWSLGLDGLVVAHGRLQEAMLQDVGTKTNVRG